MVQADLKPLPIVEVIAEKEIRSHTSIERNWFSVGKGEIVGFLSERSRKSTH